MKAWCGIFATLGLLACGEPMSRIDKTRESTIVIYGTTDEDALRPALDDFAKVRPGISITYRKMNGLPLYDTYIQDLANGRTGPDVIISSAMDLQVKLVNDGFATSYSSIATSSLPPWAEWRHQVFSITFEPVVMVFNAAIMKGRQLPQSRDELVDAIHRDPAFWKGRIGMYDIRQSSTGYLLMSQDARQGSDFGSFLATVGSTGPWTSGATANIFDEIEQGKLALGYNLLGSYARRRIKAGAPLQIVYPRDYTLALSRTAIIARNAPHPASAKAFVDYLLSSRGQSILANAGGLSPINRVVSSGLAGAQTIDTVETGPLRPIILGPGLLTYLDQQKRTRLLALMDRSVSTQEFPANTTVMDDEIMSGQYSDER